MNLNPVLLLPSWDGVGTDRLKPVGDVNKAARYGRRVTPNRGIDADFLSLPRHELADAALAAATGAGASHADLRIHRVVNEIVQLRDGELETAVVNREIGLAVRVVVDGTWGFASHAELSLEVAAETVTIGDPSFVGPLAGVSLGLHVFHILEEDIKAQIDPGVWDEQLALLEVALDVDDIRESMTRVRERIDGAA